MVEVRRSASLRLGEPTAGPPVDRGSDITETDLGVSLKTANVSAPSWEPAS